MSSDSIAQPSVQAFNANWHYPTSIRVGAGRIKELPEVCKELGICAPLLITDPGLAVLPFVKKVLNYCDDAGLHCGLFSAIKANPNAKNVEDGVSCYHAGGHDGVIAFGGGSALDAAKAVALMVGQQRPLWDFEDVGDNWKRVNEAGMAALIAVPTTAGTGSEVGRSSVITDEVKKVKKIIFHPAMLPQQVILDPQLTFALPPAITAATGMDALSHNLEAYCSPFYHPMAQGIAVEGIRMVKQNLLRCFKNGNDLEARTNMLVASSMGATAFQKGLGAMHALAHPLGAFYDMHHGLLNAVLMPYVLKANREAIEEPICRLATYLELASGDFDGFLAWVLMLRQALGIPHSLAQAGIDKTSVDDARIDWVGRMAFADPCAAGNPVAFSEQAYADIFCKALGGEL